MGASKGSMGVVTLLLANRSNLLIDSVNSTGGTALHTAKRTGHSDVYQLLIDSGARTDIRDVSEVHGCAHILN